MSVAGSGSVKTHLEFDLVLRLELVVSSERYLVDASLLVVGDSASVEPGEAVAEGAEEVMLSVVGKIGGEVAAGGGVLGFVVVRILTGLAGGDGGSLGGLHGIIVRAQP